MNDISIYNGDDKAVKLYFQEINRFPLLTREEEIELGKKIIAGDKKALKKIVQHNLKYVVYEANKYKRANPGIPFLDIVQEGNIGMINAATTWNYRKHVKFISYASAQVKWNILTAVYEKRDVIRIPSQRQKNKYKAFKILRNRYKNKTRSELFEALNKDEKYADLNYTYSSIDNIVDRLSTGNKNDHGASREERQILLDQDSERPVEEFYENDTYEYTSAKVKCILSEFKPRERKIVERFFGINRRRPAKLRQIASDLGVTLQCVGEIKDRVLRAIKKQYVEQDFYNDN